MKILNSLWKKDLKLYYAKNIRELVMHTDTCYHVRSRENGRSEGMCLCPFCGAKIYFFIWSFSGGGKRCANCGIVASYHFSGAKVDKLEIKFSEEELKKFPEWGKSV
jgi:hypothetical protein